MGYEEFALNAINGSLPVIQQRISELVFAPMEFPEMLWIVTPLIATTLLMTLYFGKYKREELGWNTAVGNSLVLLFVAIDLYRYVFNTLGDGTFMVFIENPVPTLVCTVVLLEGLALMLLNFFHALPKKVTFFISAPLSVNLVAYVAMAIIYSGIPADDVTVAAALSAFAILYIFMMMLKLFVRKISDSLGGMSEADRIEEEEIEAARERAACRLKEKKGKPEKPAVGSPSKTRIGSM